MAQRALDIRRATRAPHRITAESALQDVPYTRLKMAFRSFSEFSSRRKLCLVLHASGSSLFTLMDLGGTSGSRIGNGGLQDAISRFITGSGGSQLVQSPSGPLAKAYRNLSRLSQMFPTRPCSPSSRHRSLRILLSAPLR